MNTDLPQLDWQDWMQRYDQQQSTYLPDREQRFTVMLDVLATLLPQPFVALDLAASGQPGRDGSSLARVKGNHGIDSKGFVRLQPG